MPNAHAPLYFSYFWRELVQGIGSKKDERYKDVTIKTRLESAAEDFVMTEKKNETLTYLQETDKQVF